MNPKNYILLLLLGLLTKGVLLKEIQDIMKEYKDWGKQNGVFITDKLAIEAKSVNQKAFKVITSITANEKLLSIPYNMILSTSKALSFSDEKIHNLHNYTFNETSFSYDDPFFNHYTREVIYLTLLRYYSDKDNETINQFKSFYAPYFNTYEDDLSNFPLYYTQDEVKPLHLLDFGFKIIVRHAYVDEEKGLIKMNYDSSLNDKAYLRYRHLTKAKSYLVNNETSLIPFLELFDIALKEGSNCEWKLNAETNQIEVYSTSAINAGDKVLLSIDLIANNDLLLDYGKTIKDNTHISEFIVDFIHHTWREEENLQYVRGENETFHFDLMDLTFTTNYISVYKDIAKEKKMPQDNTTAYKLMIKNLKYYLKEYDQADDEALQKNIANEVNRLNLRRVLETEKTLIQNRIDFIDLMMSFSAHKTDL